MGEKPASKFDNNKSEYTHAVLILATEDLSKMVVEIKPVEHDGVVYEFNPGIANILIKNMHDMLERNKQADTVVQLVISTLEERAKTSRIVKV